MTRLFLLGLVGVGVLVLLFVWGWMRTAADFRAEDEKRRP
jgi:hypothetical protein